MKRQNPKSKRNKYYYVKGILIVGLLFFLPIWLNPALPSTIDIFRGLIGIFYNTGVYTVSSSSLVNSVFVIFAIYLLFNDDIKINSKIIIPKRKKAFHSLFSGYFIYSLYLIYIFIIKSWEIQTIKGNDIIDIVYVPCVFSFFLLLTVMYSVRRKIYLCDINVGSFILLLLGSAILFETFISFSPLREMIEYLLISEITKEGVKIQYIVPYYFSILSSLILSIIDLRFFNYPK